MTACLGPSENVKYLYVRNRDIRRQQYIQAIKFFINETKVKSIVFCDNSGSAEIEELKELAKKKNKKLEWISFQGDLEKTEEKGKGYGEGEILAYVIENSSLARKCEYMAKITGRLKLKNIDLVLKLLSPSKNYFNSYIDNYGHFMVDTRFFVIRIKDYQNFFLNAYKTVNDENYCYLEHCIGKSMIEKGLSFSNFPIALNIEGQSGSTGAMYFMSRGTVIIKSIRPFAQYALGRGRKDRPIKELDEECKWDQTVWDTYYRYLDKKRIIIYGAGIVGQRFYRLCRGNCRIVAWADKNFQRIGILKGRRITSPTVVQKKKYDYVVLAIKNTEDFGQVKENLINLGVSDSKIICGIPQE